MANYLQLTKDSSESEIKAYFNAVLKLSQSDNEFPINFNEVWMLVYQDKHKAVEELKEKFIQNVDYKALTQKVECANGIGYSRKTDYYLTVSCMEFFIARKVRQVFDVYRQVFHKVAENKIHLPNFNNPAEAARAWADQYEKNLVLEQENHQQAEKIKEDAPRVLFSKAVETAKRSCLVSELAKIIRQNGIKIGQNRLFRWLRDNGYLCKKGDMYNQPTQKAMDLELFEIKKTAINKPDGSVLVSNTTKVTAKGCVYFVDKFLNNVCGGVNYGN